MFCISQARNFPGERGITNNSFNPHGYRQNGPNWPAFRSFGGMAISPSLKMMGKLNIVPKSEKCKFSGAKSKIRYLGIQKVPESSKVEQVEKKTDLDRKSVV